VYNLVRVQLDVVTAFLNGKLDREIYMKCPPGLRLLMGMDCVPLKRAIYGLNQAGRAWWEELDKYLVEESGFTRAQQDWGLFVRGDGAIVVIYVDDLLAAARAEAVKGQDREKQRAEANPQATETAVRQQRAPRAMDAFHQALAGVRGQAKKDAESA
jgi:hypothetical protein